MHNAPPESPTSSGEAAAAAAQQRYSVGRQLRMIWRMNPRRAVTLLMQAYSDWSADGATRLGAALAYYTLFSIAPVVIVIVGIAGFFIGRAAAQDQVSPWLQRFLSPEGASA